MMPAREIRLNSVCALVAMFVSFAGASLCEPIRAQQSNALPPASRGPATDTDKDTYDYDSHQLTDEQRLGRDTWYFWTAGDQKFWRKMAAITGGDVDLLLYVDSRNHDRRFERLGVINHPKCTAALEPDRYGLWMDDCSEAEQVPQIPGTPAGIVGLRRFDNPAFDASKWSIQAYLHDRASIEPPYLVGMACGFCHVGLSPVNPPADPNRATWANLLPTIGNQYFEEGKLFSLNMTPSDFRWHVASQQPAGTSDTSRFATDHINNPNAINTIFNLSFRPAAAEKMRDGSIQQVPHILKDGADSVGIAGASLRVYVNIGMCGDYSVTLHDPIDGVKTPQQPFDMDRARADCEDWRATEARMPAAAAFLKTQSPPLLAAAPGGSAYLTADQVALRQGKFAFADKCAVCHSSKQPPAGTADHARWYRESVLAADFLTGNFLSDDQRYPVTVIGTNVARAVGSNATRAHIWDQFSSDTYKGLPPAGTLKGLYNPRDPGRPITFDLPAGGRGYYRTAALTGLWATAPYLHNNSVGVFVKDPSVSARMAAFGDGMEKLLWPEKRLGVRSIPVTTTDSTVAISGTTRKLRIPSGTPIDYIARVDPTELARLVDRVPLINLVLKLTPDDVILSRLLARNLAPDFVADRGHTFGAELPDADKRALIEFLKTF
jgi:cytochrome c5